MRIPASGERHDESLIVDDEEPARARLGRMLAAHPDIVVAGEARDGLEAVAKIEALHPDLIFLDIEMPGLTGFEVLQSLPAGRPDAAGDLRHRVRPARARGVRGQRARVPAEAGGSGAPGASRGARAQTERRRAAKREREQILRVVREAPETAAARSSAASATACVLTPPEQILWFQVEDGIVKAHTAAETFCGELPARRTGGRALPAVFFRARREVLVNLTRIREIRPYFKSGFLLVMADAAATEIVVSERQARSLRQRIPGL